MKFYVYDLYREDGTPFYVGRGTRRRWLCHESAVRAGKIEGNPAKFNIIKTFIDAGKVVPKKKIALFATVNEASKFEVKRIKEFGLLKNGGLLVNILPGGGAHKLVGITFSPERRAKISAALKGKPKSKTARENMSKAKRGKPSGKASMEGLAKYAASIRGKTMSKDFGAKISLAKKGIPLTEAHIKALRGKKRSTATRLNISKSLLGRSLSETHKKALRGRRHSPDTLRKMSIAKLGKKKSATTRANMRAGWVKRKEKQCL